MVYGASLGHRLGGGGLGELLQGASVSQARSDDDASVRRILRAVERAERNVGAAG
jgi:hypothetical protein